MMDAACPTNVKTPPHRSARIVDLSLKPWSENQKSRRNVNINHALLSTIKKLPFFSYFHLQFFHHIGVQNLKILFPLFFQGTVPILSGILVAEAVNGNQKPQFAKKLFANL